MRNSLSSSAVKIPSKFVIIFAQISFTIIINNKDELGSPCFTPRYELIQVVFCQLCFIMERTELYIALIALVI